MAVQCDFVHSFVNTRRVHNTDSELQERLLFLKLTHLLPTYNTFLFIFYNTSINLKYLWNNLCNQSQNKINIHIIIRNTLYSSIWQCTKIQKLVFFFLLVFFSRLVFELRVITKHYTTHNILLKVVKVILIYRSKCTISQLFLERANG